MTVFIALGSNIEPRLKYLNAAVEELQKLGDIRDIAPLYESAPYGITAQPSFLNSAVILQTLLHAEELLLQLKQIETRLGRKPRGRWAAREIDLDIIFYGQNTIRQPGLEIPHPDYHNRRFVLQPLADIAGDFKSPVSGKTLREELNLCPGVNDITLFQKNWMPDGIKL